jgi:hypothetical protein
MRKVLRGYAKGKDGSLILKGTIPILHSKDKPSPSERRDKRHLVRQGATIFIWRRSKRLTGSAMVSRGGSTDLGGVGRVRKTKASKRQIRCVARKSMGDTNMPTGFEWRA